jgi:hypothetical protein
MFLEKYVLTNNHEYILYNSSENLKKTYTSTNQNNPKFGFKTIAIQPNNHCNCIATPRNPFKMVRIHMKQ